MTRGGGTRFEKGRSGNPAGRPKKRRPQISAFDIIFGKTLTVTQNGVERELTVDEALQLQTYQEALKGSKMAIREVLKMIEKREVAIAKVTPQVATPVRMEMEHDADNADKAMVLLGIAQYDERPLGWGDKPTRLRLATWAAQAGISRPGRRTLDDKRRDDVRWATIDPDELRWPRGRRG